MFLPTAANFPFPFKADCRFDKTEIKDWHGWNTEQLWPDLESKAVESETDRTLFLEKCRDKNFWFYSGLICRITVTSLLNDFNF